MAEPYRYTIEITAEHLGRTQIAVAAIQRAHSRASEERMRKRLSLGIPERPRRAFGLVLALGGEALCIAMVPVAFWIRSPGIAVTFALLAILYGAVAILAIFRDGVRNGLRSFTDRMIDNRVRRLYGMLIARAPYVVEYELHDDRIVARAPVLKSERIDLLSAYASALRRDGFFYLRRRRRRQDRVLYFQRAEDGDAIAARLSAASVTLEP